MTNPDHYDKIVCAEIPDPVKHKKLYDLVIKHMMHGPCGKLRPDNPCMEGEPRKCRFHYPRQFNETTVQGDDSYPLYRRRNKGLTVEKCDKPLDNRWVVPYNPYLLTMFNCHMNVEVCSSIKSVKYVFKYIYKGHDKQVVHIHPEESEAVINKIQRFQDARYVSPPEALWRIFGFPLSEIKPLIMALQIHLPKKQQIRFRETEDPRDVVDRERHNKTMLTAFFHWHDVNRNAPKFLYKDFPKHFTWNGNRWNHRILKRSKRGQLVSANPAEGERYYLRLLLCHVSGPTSFDDLYTANGLLHTTFLKSVLERGLIESDSNLLDGLAEASLFQFPCALRRLFATILIFYEPGDVRKSWDDHYESF
uniref:uncharacterized protein LOC122587585 n=1 Tax=Erigeron canadensis TaxID=72917 RepID=UPI001CB8A693|nr:uncharacterized protein LOC122587585 [Erigeron canadensis]